MAKEKQHIGVQVRTTALTAAIRERIEELAEQPMTKEKQHINASDLLTPAVLDAIRADQLSQPRDPGYAPIYDDDHPPPWDVRVDPEIKAVVDAAIGGDAVSDTSFRQLSPVEQEQFRSWARANYRPGDPIDPTWHPIVREECAAINARPDAARRKEEGK